MNNFWNNMNFKLHLKRTFLLSFAIIPLLFFFWIKVEGCQPCAVEEAVTVDGVQELYNKTISSENNDLIIDTVIDQNGRLELKMAAYQIGDWNMDITQSVVISCIINPSKIVGFTVTILDDAGKLFVLNGSPDPDDAANAGGVVFHNITFFKLSRYAGGFFDGAAFDKNSWNRGYIYVTYYE